MTVTVVSTDSAEQNQKLMDAANKPAKAAEPAPAPENKPAAEGTPSAENPPESVTGDDNGTEPVAKPKADAKIDKLTKKASLAEQERDYWKEQALKGKPPVADKKDELKTEPPKPKPKAADFENQEDFIEALTDWKTDQKAVTLRNELKADKVAESNKVAETEVMESWEIRQTEARAKYSDYDEVTGNEEIALSPSMVESILTSEQGADVAYWLGKNPEEAKRIHKLSAIQQVKELGKLEAKLANEKPPESKTSTSAPAKPNKPKPPTPVLGGSKGNVTPDMSGPDVNYQEWKKWRNEQIKLRSA